MSTPSNSDRGRGGGGGPSRERSAGGGPADKMDSFASLRRSSTGSQQASSTSGSNTATNNVFRKFLMGHRTNDYHGDTAAAEFRSVRGAGLMSGGDEAGRNEPGHNRSTSRRSVMGENGRSWTRCCHQRTPLVTPDQRKKVCRKLLQNKFWRALVLIGSLILLFGAQVRTFTRASADTAFDVIFCVVFFVFILEILVRCDVEKEYWVFNAGSCCRRTHQENPNTAQAKSEGGFQIGSFLFWCELASTLALINEISFIHKREFREARVDIILDESGIPVSRNLCPTLTTHIAPFPCSDVLLTFV